MWVSIKDLYTHDHKLIKTCSTSQQVDACCFVTWVMTICMRSWMIMFHVEANKFCFKVYKDHETKKKEHTHTDISVNETQQNYTTKPFRYVTRQKTDALGT